MNVLSLFDGMSCGRITLSELGIPVEKYYASEVDKFAIKATMQNFPDTIQLGDVRELEVSRLDKIDLIIGGSPCTNLSMSDKMIECLKGRVKVDNAPICVAMRGRESACLTPKRTEYGKQIRKEYEAGIVKEQRKNIQQLEPREDGKTNCLTTVQKDNLVLVDNGNFRIRRLTPTECARLQTIPEWYIWDGISDTQRYKMLGNGWNIETIKHIFKYLKKQ